MQGALEKSLSQTAWSFPTLEWEQLFHSTHFFSPMSVFVTLNKALSSNPCTYGLKQAHQMYLKTSFYISQTTVLLMNRMDKQEQNGVVVGDLSVHVSGFGRKISYELLKFP